ncbi:hypothetical protein M409DRAFT_71660 [Zasmidium cellare ATCC 36951]|uniref:Uncharacterized protein n=1 Tax=Zasmidium cellare ATCC 36951 TaxID=1080233 RepID=A0A6A6BYE2_ZASCE|nr:uncharacterized protein M409DRAFT_71660 [Zasmidium cellare ATCC 36951]KAF2158426.1 hypothetical protein M409DRAFT_71660 [Zasmidium cellare ATCC 36951]
MQAKGLVLATLAAFVTSAPTDQYNSVAARGDDTFNIHVWNNCPFPKQIALYQITADFQMVQKSTPSNISPRGHKVIQAPYSALGMRLSGHAEWGTAAQWNHQALFEFGYSNYMGSDKDIGIGAYPIPNGKGSRTCLAKTCFPWSCPLDQGWTNPDQIKDGSPADTVCYKGKTDFKVVFCP